MKRVKFKFFKKFDLTTSALKCLKGSAEMANSVNPDQTASAGAV